MKCSYWIHELEQWMQLSWETETAVPPIPKSLLDHARTCPACSARVEAAKQMSGNSSLKDSDNYTRYQTEASARILEHVMKQVSLTDTRDDSYASDEDIGGTEENDFLRRSRYKSSRSDTPRSSIASQWKKRFASAAAALIIFTAGVLFTQFFSPFAEQETNDYVVVHLVVTVPDAHHVAVAGDWNSWDPSAHQMERMQNGDTWEIMLRIEPDREYRYQLVIDGEQWVPDPGSHIHVDDGFGGINSILEI